MIKSAVVATCGVLLLAWAGLAEGPPRFREVTLPAGKGPRWITVADMNQDGKPDIVVANADAGTLSVLLGDGTGKFREAAGSPVAAGHLPNDIAVADMNGDGHPDLVIANHQAPTIIILLGDGKGGFRPAPGSPFDVHSNPHPHAVAVADFDGDGKPEVATDSWGANQIEVLAGDGHGGIRLPGRYIAVGRRPYERLRTADFNRDGHADLVTTNLDDGTVTILLGDGKGGLHSAAGSPFAAGAKPWQMAVADLDGDGIPDLAVIPYQRDIEGPAENAVTVLRGDGKGGFAPMAASPLPLGDCRGPNSIAAGDLGGKGAETIVVACAESRTLMLFEHEKSGWKAAAPVAFKGGWGAVAVAKLTGDGRSEIVTANADDGAISIFFPQ